ncbi:2OG-Fe(II) oxygenase [Mesorhizobium sp. LHD-90]|uniref:2OG-Fe(II) oxygenase n=1 Tax=Mesorhizobium sp. LHD-90 TaxID=3071414 RepID=UPI0027E1CE9F|nr:2OG-Fe(II) oxygenase [Mesorhizobium sp. LHD-90]MDQ6434907.1 2OG-Fe(II) oxygenase [Mesorhizobium sp. LHD-90]
MPEYRVIEAGDPAPWFTQRSTSNDKFHFDTAAGRYLVLCFFGTAADEMGRSMLKIVEERRALFDDGKLAFFGVSHDRNDETQARIQESLPGVRYFFDFDGQIGQRYGSLPVDSKDGQVAIRRFWMVLDPTMRVRAIFPALADGTERAQLAAYLDALPPVESYPGFSVQAPIIVLPNVFEPAFCNQLIDLYEAAGGTESGFMREIGGKTVEVVDARHKRRADYTIEDETLKLTLRQKIIRRVVPEIQKVHQYTVTRMERYIVACYDSANGGHFRAHRDNTTKGTAHRRFAVSINLNSDFDGGQVSFPEYGPRSFKPPPGGAVVFSCSLLHAVSPVTRGKRYAFLPFLYDDAAAAIRETNNKYLDENVGTYVKA